MIQPHPFLLSEAMEEGGRGATTHRKGVDAARAAACNSAHSVAGIFSPYERPYEDAEAISGGESPTAGFVRAAAEEDERSFLRKRTLISNNLFSGPSFALKESKVYVGTLL